jgi:predicted Zn-dependent protease
LAARLAGATQPAAQAFAWAARAAPANAGYQHAAGLYSLETGQYQEAAFWAQRAAALDPASDYLDLLAVATAAHSLQRRTSIYRNP